jgi:hypothetical protein
MASGRVSSGDFPLSAAAAGTVLLPLAGPRLPLQRNLMPDFAPS